MIDVVWLTGLGRGGNAVLRSVRAKKKCVNDSRRRREALKEPSDNTKNLIIRGKTEPES